MKGVMEAAMIMETDRTMKVLEWAHAHGLPWDDDACGAAIQYHKLAELKCTNRT